MSAVIRDSLMSELVGTLAAVVPASGNNQSVSIAPSNPESNQTITRQFPDLPPAAVDSSMCFLKSKHAFVCIP